MKRGLLIAGSFILLCVFAGGIVALLGAQEREPGQRVAPAEKMAPEAATAPGLQTLGNPGSAEPVLLQVLQTPSGVLYALSQHRGFLVSFDQGQSWLEHNSGLPRRVVWPFTEDRVRLLTSLNVDPLHEARVAVTTASELYLSEDFGGSWRQIPLGKPLRSTSYLTAVALSPWDPNTILLGTSFNGFFETRDRGRSWQDPSLTARFLYRGAGFYEETSGLSYDPSETGVILFSCGFGHGIYRSSADRRSWTPLELPAEAAGAVVRRLELLPPLPGTEGAGTATTGAAGGAAAGGAVAGAGSGSAGGWQLAAETYQGRWQYRLGGGSWQRSPSLQPLSGSSPDPRSDPFRQQRIRRASGRFGVYVSSYRARGQDLENHLRFMRDNGLNALVVDCKDDFGWITYDTGLQWPKKIGAVNKRFSLEELLSKAHEQGVYVIARLVVFKDRQLYNYNGYEYAAWNGVTNQPWRYLRKVEEPAPEAEEDTVAGATAGGAGADSGAAGASTGSAPASPGSALASGAGGTGAESSGSQNGNGASTSGQPARPATQVRYVQNEYWVDPFDSFVWSYNAAIAEELQNRGVDEIQFDYIRFPSDGNLAQIRYRYQREGMSPIDALESFLTLAREKVHIPVSTDLYGFNSWNRMGNWIGQSIEVLAEYVDVVCPMFYPSHFARDFMKEEPYLERARKIYFEGTSRAAFMVDGRSIVRPYVQAFLIGGELAFGVPEYSEYLLQQVKGTLAAPSSGFTLWNASNHYYMVTSSLEPYLEGWRSFQASRGPGGNPGP
jgi:hypothetical protein